MNTPPQWTAIKRDNDGRNQWSIVAPGGCGYIERTGTCFIAHTPNNKMRRAPEETAANAHLIAASPVMLNALLYVHDNLLAGTIGPQVALVVEMAIRDATKGM